MKTIQETISHEFSSGNFGFAFDHFDEHIEWKVAGGPTIKGKQPVTDYCNKMKEAMAGSILHNTNSIVAGESIAIEGYCDYSDENNTPGKVEYCDVFSFRGEKLTTITSYAIDTKMPA